MSLFLIGSSVTAFICIFLIVYSLLMSHEDYQLSLHRYKRRRSGILLLATPILAWVVEKNIRWFGSQSSYLERLRKKVKNAGISVVLTAEELLALQEILFLGMPLAGGLLLFLFRGSIQSGENYGTVLLFLFIFGAVGALLPVLPLDKSIAARRIEIIREWPSLLDLLTLSLEAGMGLIQAIERIVDSSPLTPLMDELMHFLNETQLGTRRADALQNMADRIQVDSVTIVIKSMIQAERLGTELGPLMRIQARDFRERRAQIIETAAMEAPVKMMLPLLGFIFPAVMIILLGPAMLQYYISQ